MPRICVAMRIALLCPLLTFTASFADQRTANWSADFPPCNQRFEFRKHDSMSLGVKISTSKPELARAFRLALDFWSQVLAMDWYEDSSSSCALQLVDGTPEILKNGIVARSQFTDWDNFQGLIAFNPKTELTDSEMYLTAVHEIGHMLGLKHNPSAQSVMYYLDLQGSGTLDQTDLAALAVHHKLRLVSTESAVLVIQPQ
jgi:matrixin